MCIRDRSKIEAQKVSLTEALENSNADINAEIKQSNKQTTAKVAEIGESVQELTAKVTEIGEKVDTVDTKINERFKVFETTMQKSFIEQVTRCLLYTSRCV